MKYEIDTTSHFDKWLKKLRDSTVRYRLLARFDHVAKGNFGDTKRIATNLFELRFFFGSGYRVYYTIQNEKIVLLLCGGDKSTQSKDITRAKLLLAQLE